MGTDGRSSLFILLLGIVGILFPTLVTTAPESVADPGRTSDAPASSVAPANSALVRRQLCESAVLGPFEQYYAEPPAKEHPATAQQVTAAQKKIATARIKDAGAHDAATEAGVDHPSPEQIAAVDLLPSHLESWKGKNIQFLVATLPDPVDSGLAYDFDQDLEALQLAIERGGRLRDRSWLPWNPLAASAPDDLERIRECRTEAPGVLLFRKADGADGPELLVLFVVGETPTWGVHRAALELAFDLVDTYAAYNGGAPKIDIVGPTFSGSTSSIKRTIADWLGKPSRSPMGGRAKPSKFSLVSGTATSDDNVKVRGPVSVGGRDVGEIDFHATTLPDHALRCALFTYLHDRLGVRDPEKDGVLTHVALLHESGTEYGRAFGAGASACPREALRFGFPPHISALRSAYEVAERKRAAAQPDPGEEKGPRPPTKLDPSLEESTPPRDIEPTLSNKTTFAHDVVLANLIREIGQRDIHYVGIVATDPADVIFLAQRVRTAAPDVRLFTFGSEIFFLHPAFTRDLDGMLVATPYPFFGASELRRATHEGTVLTFAGQGPEGIYNATRATLAGDAGIGDAGLVEFPPQGTPVGSLLPTWISVVSRGRLVPLQAMESNSTGYLVTAVAPSTTEAPGRGWGDEPSKVWVMAVLVTSLFAIANVAAFVLRFFRARKDGDGQGQAGSIVARFFDRFEPCMGGSERVKHRYYVFATLVALALAQWTLASAARMEYLGSPAIRFLHGAAHVVAGAVILCAAGALVTTINDWLIELRAVLARRTRDPSVDIAGTISVLGLLVCGVAMGGAAAYGLREMQTETMQVGLYVERATSLLGGASPVTPLFVTWTAMYVWGQCQLSRIHLLDAFHVRHAGPRAADPTPGATPKTRTVVDAEHGPMSRRSHAPPAPAAADDSGFRFDYHKLARGVCDTIGSTLDAGVPYWLATTVLVGVAVMLFFLKPPLILERVHVQVLLCFAFALLVLVTGSGIVRLLLFASRLGALLGRIAKHPIADALSRLPQPLARSVEVQVSARSSDVRELVVPVRQAELLVARVAELAPTEETDATMRRAVHRLVRVVTGVDPVLGAQERERLREVLRRELTDTTSGKRRIDLGDSPTMQRLTEASAPLWDVADELWRAHVRIAPKEQSPEQLAKSLSGTGTALDAYEGTLSDAALAWLRLAEELIAAHLSFTISHLLRHFRHFTTTVTVGAFAMLLFVSSYAMQPKRILLTFVWIVMLSAVGAGMFVYFKLERDEVLSRIAKNDPGKIDWTPAMAVRVLAWGVLPVLSVAAAQYPGAASTVFGWLSPFTKLLH